MQLTPRYLCNNITTVIADMAGFITEYRPVYSKQLQLYRGIDNVLDFRLLNDLSIITEFNDYFSLENKIIFRHDSDPPSALKEDDLAFVAGVIFSF